MLMMMMVVMMMMMMTMLVHDDARDNDVENDLPGASPFMVIKDQT